MRHITYGTNIKKPKLVCLNCKFQKRLQFSQFAYYQTFCYKCLDNYRLFPYSIKEEIFIVKRLRRSGNKYDIVVSKVEDKIRTWNTLRLLR